VAWCRSHALLTGAYAFAASADSAGGSAAEIELTSRLNALALDPMSVLRAIDPNALKGLH